MKKICHVTSAHLPFDGRIFERECTSLARHYDVYMIVPNTADCKRNNVHVIGVQIPSSRVKRVLHLKKVYKKMCEVNADVYHIHEPELIPYALKIKKKGKRIIFDSHEDVPATIFRMNYIPRLFRGCVSCLYSAYEKKAIKKFDAVVSVTPSIVERLKKSNNNTYMITNYPIYNDVNEENHEWERRIGFAGTVSPNWNIITVINAIQDIDVVFELIGPADSYYFNQLRSLPGWEKVKYHGQVKHTEVLDIMKRCSIGLALEAYDNPNAGGKKGSLGVTKMFEYMQLGIPVIATDLENWIPVIEGTQSGYCVNPSNVSQIRNTIEKLLNDISLAKEFGSNGRRAIKEKYCWQTQEKVLLEIYRLILGE